MLQVKDLLDISKLGTKMLLVEKPQPYTKFEGGIDTGEIIGYKYNLVLSEYNWDKIFVKLEGATPAIKAEQLVKGQPLVVKVEDLQAHVYVQNNRAALSFKARSIQPFK
ncbi:hypothetical protein K7T73_03510 [Bacillus badius]|uniref:hypothetical protein n=1 Tax=Bacillus badius TaxID=1455 RepID=UPI001CBC0B67|nr:hypothetical protein [Bacillus badius]UAT31314.1 hypothetical protein K7T73_03510 [Bacillus badius]